jgi:hypothetical protein
MFGYEFGFGQSCFWVYHLFVFASKAADWCDVFLMDGFEKLALARFWRRMCVGDVVERVGRSFDVFGVG